MAVSVCSFAQTPFAVNSGVPFSLLQQTLYALNDKHRRGTGLNFTDKDQLRWANQLVGDEVDVTLAKPNMGNEADLYRQQGFGHRLGIRGELALLIVDFVVGFANEAAFGGGNIQAAIAATVEVLAEARRRRWAIAHTRIVFADDASDVNVFCLKVPTLPGLKEDSPDSAIVPQLTPLSGELVVRKTLPSAFFDTGLRAWFTQRQVETLFIAGCTTSGCVRASVVDAMSCGFRPIVLSDCVGDRALTPHEASLYDMDQKYADVTSSSNLLASLSDAESRQEWMKELK